MKTIMICSIVIAGAFVMNAEEYDNSRNFQVQVITALKNNEARLNTAIERVNNLQDNYMVLVQNINSLKNALAIEQQKNADLHSQMETLKKQITADRSNMQQTLNTAVDKIAKETSAAVSRATSSSRFSAQTSGGKPPYGSGKFAEYKVQNRATLNAVAKAYNVSIDSIRKANGLKNGSKLVEGQILYIPQN